MALINQLQIGLVGALVLCACLASVTGKLKFSHSACLHDHPPMSIARTGALSELLV